MAIVVESTVAFVKEIVIDEDNVVWIGVTLGGVVRFDGRSWEKFTPDDSELLSDFVLDLAKSRLVSGLSVVDTAYSLGFNYPHHFTRAFKQRFGLLPSDYQKGAK